MQLMQTATRQCTHSRTLPSRCRCLRPSSLGAGGEGITQVNLMDALLERDLAASYREIGTGPRAPAAKPAAGSAPSAVGSAVAGGQSAATSSVLPTRLHSPPESEPQQGSAELSSDMEGPGDVADAMLAVPRVEKKVRVCLCVCLRLRASADTPESADAPVSACNVAFHFHVLRCAALHQFSRRRFVSRTLN